MVVVRNLRRVKKSWAHLTRVFGIEGENDQILGMFYVSVMQAVLLYASETWVISPCIGRTLGGFNHRVTRRMRGRTAYGTRWEVGVSPADISNGRGGVTGCGYLRLLPS